MSKRFRGWLSSRDDDAELDALLAGAWEDGVAALADVLDLDAGKAALAAARDRLEKRGAAGEQGAAADGVREDLDVLLARINAEINVSDSPARSAVMADLFAARQFLIQLRAGLTKRRLAKEEALQLADSIEHALKEACHTLRHLPAALGGAPAQEAVNLLERISVVQQQIPALAGKIRRLYADAGDPEPLVPTR
jgi:hypothetical protein